MGVATKVDENPTAAQHQLTTPPLSAFRLLVDDDVELDLATQATDVDIDAVAPVGPRPGCRDGNAAPPPRDRTLANAIGARVGNEHVASGHAAASQIELDAGAIDVGS